MEPIGVDTFFGSNPIDNHTTNRYYTASYQTGYLWESQVIDLRSMSITYWLTALADKVGA